jgi:ribosomal protein L40E
MRGYLTVPDTDLGGLLVESRVELYRDPDQSHRVLARTESGTHDLGVSDRTVSRLKKGTPPVIIRARESHIEVTNRRNSNGVTVEYDEGQTNLPEGRTETVTDTASIELGWQTTLVLRVKQEAKVTVKGDVDGDVVTGDQTNVDDRTQIEDAVINRSKIGGEGGNSVKDSVLNRSDVGGSNESDDDEAQNHCERHDRMYTGDNCPECVSAEEGEDETVDTKFCLYCGTAIPVAAPECSECGSKLPDGA